MTLDEAIEIVRAMDRASKDPFTPAEREAIRMLGTAAWSGEIQLRDPRLAGLPDIIMKIIRAMQGKRDLQ